MRSRLRNAALCISAIWFGSTMLGISTAQAAEPYPNKPVRIIVPFGPGSVSAVLARAVAEELQHELGGTFVVETKPGASGIVAAKSVIQAAPDGYTLLLGTNTTNAANQYLFKELPYHTLNDFTPVARLTLGQQILVINPSIPANSVKELMELVRKNPQDFAYTSTNSTNQITFELINTLSGIKILQVPFKNSSDAYVSIMAGRVAMGFGDHVNTVPQIKSGKLKALAVTGASRSRILTDVPTLTEAGFPGSLNNWAGLLGPAGMPAGIVDRLSTATNKVLKDPKLIARIHAIGYEPYPAEAQEFKTFLAQDAENWRDAIVRGGIQPQ